MWFLDSPPKKVRRRKFPWRLALQNSSYNNFIRYRKLKILNFWKKALKLPKFQKPISQEPFRVGWKNFAHFCFLLVETFEQNLIKIWEDGVTKLKILSLFDVESPKCPQTPDQKQSCHIYICFIDYIDLLPTLYTIQIFKCS